MKDGSSRTFQTGDITLLKSAIEAVREALGVPLAAMGFISPIFCAAAWACPTWS